MLKTTLFIAFLALIPLYKPQIANAPITRKEPRIEAFIDKLAYCESSNDPKALTPKDGGTRSVGLLQFKDATFAFYSKKFDLPYEKKDIWDPVKQREMAYLILTKDKAYSNWYNCSKKLKML